MLSKLLTLCVAVSVLGIADAQVRNDDVWKYPEMDASNSRMNLRIPDVNGYKVLKGDFHIHTVFSDGRVWPDVRVSEAWRDGLDVIAITDHIESKHSRLRRLPDFDHNESYRIAAKRGAELGVLVVPGAEITRRKPEGHVNALFVKDAKAFDVESAEVAMDSAREQGALLMLNHPGWPDDNSELSPVQQKWIKEGRFTMLEVFNFQESYPKSFDDCKKYNLAISANSDVHDPLAMTYGVGQGLRPMTLLFAHDKSLDGVREAIENRRTLAYFNGELVGDADLLANLVKACLKVNVISMESGRFQVENLSDLPFVLSIGKQIYYLKPNSTIRISMKQPQDVELRNCRTGKDGYLKFTPADLEDIL